MSDQSGPLPGPDLARGVERSTLADGGMLAGHVGDDAVLLARRGDEFFAIGATCSHYGGPLAEGLMVGDTVRCPWHHACFDLRTGRVLRNPALHDLPCWAVEQRGTMIHVAARITPPPPKPVRRGPNHVLIVGAGAAGNAAAEMLRREGYEGSIVMVDADADAPCDRPNLSKDYLAGSAPEEWMPLHPPAFYDEHRIDLVRARADRIDREKKTLILRDGRAIPFDVILLATGAEPNRLKIPVSGEVHYLRSLADSRAIIRAAEGRQRVVVLGASFIGLEVAASLRSRGLEVHVVAPDAHPLERVVGAELGDVVRAVHESHGVVFHLGQKPASVEAGAVVLESGERLEADFVVAGIGVTPRLELAESSRLTLDRGVVVNEMLETSSPGIYAAGDIARWPDPHSGQPIRVEHWVVAERQGQAAAKNMLGRAEKFTAVPFFWSVHFELGITYSGHAERWDNLEISGSLAERDAALFYKKEGRTLATVTVAVLGSAVATRRDHQNLQAELAMEQGGDPAAAVNEL